MILLGSAFRNSRARLDEYLTRLDAFRAAVDEAYWLPIEGDSTDTTALALQNALDDDRLGRLVRHAHHGPVYGSTEEPARMTALSGLFNAWLEAVGDTTLDDDVVVWVERDLHWDPATIVALVDRLQHDGVDVVAPNIMAADAVAYDVWADRLLDGRRISPFPPFVPQEYRRANCLVTSGVVHDAELIEMSSVGSCVAMRGVVARTCRIRDDNAIVGFCADVRAHGFRVWLALDQIVRHPV